MRPIMIGESTISAAADVDATAVSKYRPFFSPRAAIRCGAGASAVNDTLMTKRNAVIWSATSGRAFFAGAAGAAASSMASRYSPSVEC